MEHDVSRDAHGIVEVSLNLVQDILGGAAEKDGAGLGVLTLGEEGEVFITNLRNFEETTLSTNVGGSGSEDGVDNCSTCCPCDTVVVGFTYTADCCDVCLDEKVLCEILGSMSATI